MESINDLFGLFLCDMELIVGHCVGCDVAH